MKWTGKYEPTSTDVFDLDHDINIEVEKINSQLIEINESYTPEESKKIKKALIETILEEL